MDTARVQSLVPALSLTAALSQEQGKGVCTLMSELPAFKIYKAIIKCFVG